MFFGKRFPRDDPKKREDLRNKIEAEGGLEKHDLLAMVLAAFLVLFPVAVLILIAICFFVLIPVW